MKKPLKIAIIILVVIALGIISFLVKDMFNKPAYSNDNNTFSAFKSIFREENGTGITLKLTDKELIDTSHFEVNYYVIKSDELFALTDSGMYYELKMLDENNKEIDLSSTNMIVSMPYSTSQNRFEVLFLDETNGKFKVTETIDAYYENGQLVFTTNHLGIFLIKESKISESEAEKKNEIVKNEIVDKNNLKDNEPIVPIYGNNSDSNGSSIQKWIVTICLDGCKRQEVEDGALLTEPTLPQDSDKVIDYWLDANTGNTFNFNTPIHKNYNINAILKVKEKSGSNNGVINQAHPLVTSAPQNIYFTNEKYFINNISGVVLTWDKVENALQYNIYYSSSENGSYGKLNSSIGTFIETNLKEGYYKLSAVNSDDIEGPLSEAIYVPGPFSNGITATLNCNCYFTSTIDDAVCRDGYITIDNPNNYDVMVFKYTQKQDYKLDKADDLGKTNYKVVPYACWPYSNATYNPQYYIAASYKKSEHYMIYSIDYNELKSCNKKYIKES